MTTSSTPWKLFAKDAKVVIDANDIFVAAFRTKEDAEHVIKLVNGIANTPRLKLIPKAKKDAVDDVKGHTREDQPNPDKGPFS